MKTIEELYNEILANEELKKEFLALKPEEVEGFAAKHGCTVSADEIRAFCEAKKSRIGALSDEELDQIAGGKGFSELEAFISLGMVGLGCAAVALVSAIGGSVGTAIEGDRMLCGAIN